MKAPAPNKGADKDEDVDDALDERRLNWTTKRTA